MNPPKKAMVLKMWSSNSHNQYQSHFMNSYLAKRYNMSSTNVELDEWFNIHKERQKDKCNPW